MIHPELVDNMPLLLKVKEFDLTEITSLQESRLKFSFNKAKGKDVRRQESSDWGIGFSLLTDNQEAFYSTNNFEGMGTELTNIASRLQGGSLQDEPIANHENLVISKSIVDIGKSGYWTDFYEEEAFFLLNDINSILEDTPFYYRIRVEGEYIKKSFQSSAFLDITQSYKTALVTVEIIGRTPFGPISRVDVIGGVNKTDLKWNNVEQKIRIMIDEVHRLGAAKTINSGNYNVVFNPDSAYSLAHETIGHACEGDQIVTKNSFLTDKIGFKIASSDLTIIDDPHIRGLGWSSFDDEGIKVKGNILVDEGILTNYLHSKKTARMLGDETTGNARASSYLSPAEPRQSNIYVEPRDFSFEELLEEVHNGILIGPTLSASTSIYTGDFSIESQFGWFIEHGELKEITGPLTATGQAIQALNSIIGIGKTVETIPTYCLKEHNKLSIGAISPSIGVHNIRIN